MRWRIGISRTHSKLWITGFKCVIIILAMTLLGNDSVSRERKKKTDGIVKIDKYKMIEPASSLMPEYPQAAYEANVSAEVWVRCKLDSNSLIDTVEVISCSADSLGFEEAAVNWIMSKPFGVVHNTKKNTKDWYYSKLDFMIEKWDWHLLKTGRIKLIPVPVPMPEPVVKDSSLNYFKPLEEMPKLTHKPKMRYPKRAWKYGRSAKVTVKVLVLQDGSAKDVVIADTSDPDWLFGFNEAAIEGAKLCKFKPAKQNGKPVNVWVQFPFEFNLGR